MAAVRSALTETEGVTECEVDFNNRIATVKIDPEKFDQQAALDALDAEGFPATIVQ